MKFIQKRFAAASALILLVLLFPRVNAQETPENTVRGSVDHVTVYQGQAMVSRSIPIPEGDTDQQRIVVKDLPSGTRPNSIYAEGSDEVTIQSVRYRTRPVQKDIRKEVRKLDEKIRTKKRDIQRIEKKQETISSQRDLLQKLQKFTAPSADWELSHGVLDAETIKSLTGFFFQKQESLAEEEQKLAFQKSDAQENLEHLKRERQTLTNRSSRTRREAVVSLSGGEGSSFELRYLVDNAGWSPSYNLRTTDQRNQIQLEYLASVHQMSGEDWNNVRMTLSTANPSLVSEPPALSQLPIQLRSSASATSQRAEKKYSKQLKSIQKRQQKLNVQRNVHPGDDHDGAKEFANKAGGQSRGGFHSRSAVGNTFDQKLNRLSSELQLLELSSGQGQDREGPSTEKNQNQQQASVRYELPGRTNLPSRNDKQLVRITSREIDAQFYRIARPVLTSQVYEQAKLTNTFDWILLTGPSNSYLAGQFVGRGTVPTVSVGESFEAGFGIDSDLRSGRELIDRDISTQGGNKIVEVTYRLTLSNFSKNEKSVRLFDRLPVPERNHEVRVTLLDADQKPVKKPTDHNQRVKPGSDGILRWDVTVPPESTGDDQWSLNYTYSLEYAKNRSITK